MTSVHDGCFSVVTASTSDLTISIESGIFGLVRFHKS